jgi:hypothetical protein
VSLDDLEARLAAGLRGLVDGAAIRRERSRQVLRRTTASVLEPAPSSPLRRLDDRFASHGPLALLRDVPQLGFLVVAAVLLTGSVVALDRSSTPHRATAIRQQADATLPTTLGPAPGTRVADYLAQTQKRAQLVSESAPDKTFVALISFTSYLTPTQARALLGDLEVRKVMAHLHLSGAEVLPIPVTASMVPDLHVAFAAIAQRKEKDRVEFVNLARTITGSSKEERTFKAFYLDAARTAGLEKKAYASKECPCVFAALVRGKARELAGLPSLHGIRAVDIGGADDDTLQLQPLLPEQAVTVTRPVTPAQGNGA